MPERVAPPTTQTLPPEPAPAASNGSSAAPPEPVQASAPRHRDP